MIYERFLKAFLLQIANCKLPTVCCLLLLAPLSILAQKKNQNPYRSSVAGEEPMALRVGGFWNPTYFGGKIGMDIPLKIIESRNLRGLFGGRSFQEWYLLGDASYLHLPDNTDLKLKGLEIVGLSAELTYRRMAGNGLFLQASAGIGGNYLLPPFLSDSAFAESDFQLQNQWFLTPSVNLGIGRDFALGKRHRHGVPITIVLRGNFSGMLPLPQFQKIYFAPTAELSFAYRFATWQIATRQVRRN